MEEVIGNVNIPKRPLKHNCIRGITLCNLNLMHPWVIAQLVGISNQHSNSVVVSEELSD